MEAQEILPDEIILEILSRLPAKSLIKLQLVCKKWQSIVYSVYFAETRANASAFAFFPCVMKKIMPNTGAVLRLGSSNGLLLMRFVDDNKYCLWNPTIHKLFEVPDPHQDNYIGMALSYVPASRRFKLLSVHKDEDSAEVFEVFTPGHSQVWERLPLTLPDIPEIIDGERCTIKKHHLWFFPIGEEVHCLRSVRCSTNSYYLEVISVNMRTESLSVTPTTEYLLGSLTIKQKPLDWNGQLGFAVVKGENLHVMVLEKYRKKHRWSEIEKTIPLPFVKKEKLSSDSVIPLIMANDGDIWFCLKEEKLVSYNTNSLQVANIDTVPAGRVFIPYKPSTFTFEGMQPDTKLERYRPRSCN